MSSHHRCCCGGGGGGGDDESPLCCDEILSGGDNGGLPVHAWHLPIPLDPSNYENAMPFDLSFRFVSSPVWDYMTDPRIIPQGWSGRINQEFNVNFSGVLPLRISPINRPCSQWPAFAGRYPGNSTAFSNGAVPMPFTERGFFGGPSCCGEGLGHLWGTVGVYSNLTLDQIRFVRSNGFSSGDYVVDAFTSPRLYDPRIDISTSTSISLEEVPSVSLGVMEIGRASCRERV